MASGVKGLIFALLYRNLMRACQIWCERCAPPQVHAGLGLDRNAHDQICGCHKAALARFLFSLRREFELVRGIEHEST